MRIVLLALYILIHCALFGQLNGRYTFRHIGPSEDLLHSWVKGIAQDENGYMWFLTEGGLQRYDGHSFVNYPELLDVYPGEIFRRLYADQKGSLMMNKGDRIIRFDLHSHKFSTLTGEDVFAMDPQLPTQEYSNFMGNRVRITPKIALVYEKDSEKVISSMLNHSAHSKGRSSWLVTQDPVTGYYLSYDCADLIIWDPASKSFFHSARDTTQFPVFKAYNRIKTQCHRGLLMDSSRRLWIHRDDYHIYRLDFNTLETKHFSLLDIAAQQETQLSHTYVPTWGILEDRQQNIWIATENAGLLLLDPKTDEFQWISSSEKYSHGLRYNYSIDDIFLDRDENIWLATDRGINVFNPSTNHFQLIRRIEGEAGTLPKHEVNSVIETSQGEILVSTWGGGITIYDLQWNFIRNVKFPNDQQVIGFQHDFSEIEKSEMNMVWSFVELDDGTIWAGGQHGFIHIYNPVSRTFRTERPEATLNSTIRRMAKDKDGNVYLALNNGRVVHWNKKGNKFYPFNHKNNAYEKHMAPLAHVMIDQSDRCWVVSEYCLLEYDKRKLTYSGFHCPDDSVARYFFRTVEQWNDSMLIVGLRGKGALLFNINTSKFTPAPFQSDIEHLTVGAIKKDEEGNLWLCAGNSIYKYNQDLSSKSIVSLGNNTLTADFDFNPMISLSDGRWVVSTPSEVICFDPRMIRKEEAEDRRVLISGFTLMKRTMNIDSILSVSEPLVLQYDQNFFSIEFSSQEYVNVFDITYSYRLRGIEEEWNSSSTKHFADYTDLKPDEYVFEVKAIYGSHESPVTSFPIIINPPWWATWWFRSIYIVALAALGYWVLRKRIQAIRKEAELKHRISETEMMALRAQMNPHFIFNCLNGIDAMIHSDDKYRATMYLNKFAKLIRNVLESSKQNKVTLSKDLETLQLYIDLELFRHRNKFSASIHTDNELLLEEYTVPPLVIQPYVENAILHGLRHRPGLDGKLSISVKKEGEFIVYRIEDNGVGRKSTDSNVNDRSSGYGMQMSEDRIKLFNEEEVNAVQVTDLVSNGKPTGTVVQVRLKIHER